MVTYQICQGSAIARSRRSPANVKNLELQWVFQTRGPAETNEVQTTPLVDGIMSYGAEPRVALDAATGRMFWLFSPRSHHWRACAAARRGLAILGDTLFAKEQSTAT